MRLRSGRLRRIWLPTGGRSRDSKSCGVGKFYCKLFIIKRIRVKNIIKIAERKLIIPQRRRWQGHGALDLKIQPK
jgi:hypothetical protein